MNYKMLMRIGKLSGCHQRLDRSFIICGKQFPVCARCTGVFLGEIVSLVSFRYWKPPIDLAILFCLLMLIDWFIQNVKIRESTNSRRFITGTLCGYGFIGLFLHFINYMNSFIS